MSKTALPSLDEFHAGDIRALSRVISCIENRSDNCRELLSGLYKSVGRSLRIGVTGPPGGGKSTLVSCLIERYLMENKRIGVIAVDPTSPFTGGALLGDRVRMGDFAGDGRIYFRSMATRGATGGLAAATHDTTIVYDAFGFDITLIETVGVGQVELDVIDTCDVVIVVVVPESGDAVQTMKAGLMEIADIFCVNKADRPGADRITMELEQMLGTRRPVENAWPIPVVATDAVAKTNIDKLHEQIGKFVEHSRASGRFEQHRREQIQKQIIAVLRNRFHEEFIARVTGGVEFAKILDDIFSGRTDPFTVGDELYRRFVAA